MEVLVKVVYFICFGLIVYRTVNAYNDFQKEAIKLLLDPATLSCANSTGVTPEQVEAAKQKKDINQISACFFRCFLVKTKLINQVSGKEVLNVPATLVFAKLFIPTISLVNVIPISAEVLRCATEFNNKPVSDDQPGCPKTKVLVNCLVQSTTLVNSIKQAARR